MCHQQLSISQEEAWTESIGVTSVGSSTVRSRFGTDLLGSWLQNGRGERGLEQGALDEKAAARARASVSWSWLVPPHEDQLRC